jgi:hypothetical protein
MLFSFSGLTTALVFSAALLGSVAYAAPIDLQERAVTCATVSYLLSSLYTTNVAG